MNLKAISYGIEQKKVQYIGKFIFANKLTCCFNSSPFFATTMC